MKNADYPHTSLLTVTGLSNYLYESGHDVNIPFVLDKDTVDLSDIQDAHSDRVISARVFSNITWDNYNHLNNEIGTVTTNLLDLTNQMMNSNTDNYGQILYGNGTSTGLFSVGKDENKFVTDLSLRKYLRGDDTTSESFWHTEIYDKMDSNAGLANYDNTYFTNGSSFVTPVGLSNILVQHMIADYPRPDESDVSSELTIDNMNIYYFENGNHDSGRTAIPSVHTLSNYVYNKIKYYTTTSSDENTDKDNHIVPTVTYTSNMINTVMLNYLETNFDVQHYDGVIENNLLFQGSFFSRTHDIFGKSSRRFYPGSNTGNQPMSDDRSMGDNRYLDSFSMDTSASDYFSTDFSSMSTAESLVQDSEQTYASILSTKLLYEVMTNSDKLMHMGSIYRMMNDFYEIKRISTTNFNDLVTSRFYSNRIFINSSDVSSDRTLISVGWKNEQALNYSEDPIFEVSTDKSTMINGDLLLGRKKWMLSFDEDSLSIKKYDPRTGRYVEKHVFT